MKTPKLRFILILGLMTAVLSSPCLALQVEGGDDFGAEPDVQGVLSHGVVHNIANDRKVKKIGGVYQPEGLDIYLRRHLDTIYTQMQQMETEMQQMREDLKVIRLALEKSEPPASGSET